MHNPERGLLADMELLERCEKHAAAATDPMVRASYEADIRYLRYLIETHEKWFFEAHEI